LLTLSQRSKATHTLITADGRPVGYLCWQRPPRDELEEAGLADLPEDLVDIDILIGEPEYLGRGIGPRALSFLLTKLRSEGVGFVGLATSTSNRAAIKAYEKVGFRFFRDFEELGFGPFQYMLKKLCEDVN
jgi:aminoglycoside 6'-N-acetyltransferase